MPSTRVESLKNAIISVVPLAVRERNILASILFVTLLIIALHLVAIDTSTDANMNGIISPMELSFEFKKMNGMAWLDYVLASAIVAYSLCIPFAIWADDI